MKGSKVHVTLSDNIHTIDGTVSEQGRDKIGDFIVIDTGPEDILVYLKFARIEAR